MNILSDFSKRRAVLSTQRILVLLSVSVAVLLFGQPASAQLNFGRILGSVTDQSCIWLLYGGRLGDRSAGSGNFRHNGAGRVDRPGIP
jgi:hypothetical protein